MELELRWKKPLHLIDGSEWQMIYCLDEDDEDSIPEEPGIYVFGRKFGDSFVPLYIGQAKNLCSRIGNQFNNLRLMRGIEDAESGKRLLVFAEFYAKPGQQLAKCLDIIESALIENALTQGFELLNKQGTKTPTHALNFSGARDGARIFSKEMYVRAR